MLQTSFTMALATVLGTAASVALFRYEFPGKRILQVLLFPPIAIPWLITGTAMLVFFFAVGIGRGAGIDRDVTSSCDDAVEGITFHDQVAGNGECVGSERFDHECFAIRKLARV